MVSRTVTDSRSYVRDILWLTLESGARVQINASEIDVVAWDRWASTNPTLATLLEAAVFPVRKTSVLHVTVLGKPQRERHPYFPSNARVVDAFDGPAIEISADLLEYLKFRVRSTTLRGAVGRGAYLGAEIALRTKSPHPFALVGQDAGEGTAEALSLLHHYWCARRAAVTSQDMDRSLSPRDAFSLNRGGALRAPKSADARALEVAVRAAAPSPTPSEASRPAREALGSLATSVSRRALWGGLAEVAAVIHAQNVPLDPAVIYSSAWGRLIGSRWDAFESALRRLPTWVPRDVAQVLPTATTLAPILDAVASSYESNPHGRR